MKKNTKTPLSPEWLQTMYEAAWNQYSHEDNLAQERTNLFITAHGALLAILAFATNPLLEAKPVQLGNVQVPIGLSVLGLLAIIIGVSTFILGSIWKAVTKAGESYIQLRRKSLVAIERYAGLEAVHLAQVEEAWRNFSEINRNATYNLFPEERALQDLTLKAYPGVGGWQAPLRAISIIQAIDILVFLAGIILTVLGLWQVYLSVCAA